MNTADIHTPGDGQGQPGRQLHIPLALLYLLAAVVCTQVPLLNYLGFEFSLVTALLVTVTAGPAAIREIRQALNGADRTARVTAAFNRSLLVNLSLLVIPLIVMLTNALFVKNCSLASGIGFFLLIPVVTAWFASCLGFFCAAHYGWARVMYFLFVGISVAYALALGYFTPAIFSYNVFYGYFPGLTYDETLDTSTTLMTSRIITVLFGFVIAWFAFLLVRITGPSDRFWRKGILLLRELGSRRLRTRVILIVLVAGALYAFRCEIGLESTSGYIRGRLGSVFRTDHFRIYYSSSSFAPKEIPLVAAEHEFRLRQVLDAFHLECRDTIESYIYSSPGEKQELMGAGTTNIAKPWSGQVHITRQSLDATLKHELVHVIAGRFGLPVLHASLSTGLVEGLAMAVEWEWGNRTLHEYAAAMKHFRVAPDIRSIMSLAGFASHASSVSYVLCGSFCRFLIDRYGIRLMTRLYGTNNYEQEYGRTLDSLVSEWEGFLDTVPRSDTDRDVIDVLFRRPPIFGKVCARVVAGRNREAREALAQREYERAADLYRVSYDEGRGYEALAGFLTAEVRRGHHETATSILDTVILRDERPAQFLPLFLLVGDATWAGGDTAEARALYQRLSCADLSDGYTAAAVVRQIALTDAGVRQVLLRHFLSGEADSLRIRTLDSLRTRFPADKLVGYLHGVMNLGLQRYDDAVADLDTLDMLSLSPVLEAMRLEHLGSALFHQYRFEDARAAFWISLNHVDNDARRNRVEDWVDRCDWVEHHGTGGREGH